MMNKSQCVCSTSGSAGPIGVCSGGVGRDNRAACVHRGEPWACAWVLAGFGWVVEARAVCVCERDLWKGLLSLCIKCVNYIVLTSLIMRTKSVNRCEVFMHRGAQ